MSDMTAALERIQAACPCGLTTPGMSAEEIEKKLSFFPFRLPREAYEFYQRAGAPTGHRDGDPCDFTYDCPLERILGNACDFIEFQSIELAELGYPPGIYPPTLEDRKLFLFVSYREHLKDGPLCIQGSETQVDTAPVFLR